MDDVILVLRPGLSLGLVREGNGINMWCTVIDKDLASSARVRYSSHMPTPCAGVTMATMMMMMITTMVSIIMTVTVMMMSSARVSCT